MALIRPLPLRSAPVSASVSARVGTPLMTACPSAGRSSTSSPNTASNAWLRQRAKPAGAATPAKWTSTTSSLRRAARNASIAAGSVVRSTSNPPRARSARASGCASGAAIKA
ncbi:hypothetical protein DVA67_033030 [Solirubrobacter sp. CPCC 204708]|nr:hypothetical protein [Solirubrobacter deserti]